MGEKLAAGNIALALLVNTIATGAALVAIILAFGPISGAHLNPAVTLADAWRGGIAWRETPVYIIAQMAGAFAGVITAHLMFGLSVVSISAHVRSGPAQLFSEFIATFGLLAVIWGCVWQRPSAVPFAVGAYSQRVKTNLMSWWNISKLNKSECGLGYEAPKIAEPAICMLPDLQARSNAARKLGVIEQEHEAIIHVELLVAVE